MTMKLSHWLSGSLTAPADLTPIEISLAAAALGAGLAGLGWLRAAGRGPAAEAEPQARHEPDDREAA
ncbi:MAG: hypothetical protein HYY35_10370 [Deltaproteobacteria bacterium]|nr:hypothetical protein [Deltaproteobacteria bacterium]